MIPTASLLCFCMCMMLVSHICISTLQLRTVLLESIIRYAGRFEDVVKLQDMPPKPLGELLVRADGIYHLSREWRNREREDRGGAGGVGTGGHGVPPLDDGSDDDQELSTGGEG
eukprot:TRINITY_DN9663_c0_g1_i3.p2 TRINITY_DN9663_c0_g1~~TRINITY_DN9663_c0_g1_i3.p2  ORF type:complete len:114 (+),score=5.69 TRINITY_DN9663_c0_g1_i3:241-582(+)